MKRLILIPLLLICGRAVAQDYVPSTDASTTPQWNDELRKLRDGATQTKTALDTIFPINIADSSKVTGVLGIPNSQTIDALLPAQGSASGKFLTSSGTNASWGTVTQSIGSGFLARKMATSASVSNQGMTKVIEMTCGSTGTFKIYFSIYNTYVGYDATGRIYKNGTPIGTTRTNTSGGWVEYSEDLSFDAGDLIQVYLSNSNGYLAYAKGLKVVSTTVPAQWTGADYVPNIYSGTGVPTTDMGIQGDMYIRTDGSTSTTLYVNTGASTWTSK